MAPEVSVYTPTSEVMMTIDQDEGEPPLSASLVFDYLTTPNPLSAVSPVDNGIRRESSRQAPQQQHQQQRSRRSRASHTDSEWIVWMYKDVCAENEGLKAHISVLETKLDNATQMMSIVTDRANAEAKELAQGSRYLRDKRTDMNKKIAELTQREIELTSGFRELEDSRHRFEAYRTEWVAQINNKTWVAELKRNIQKDIMTPFHSDKGSDADDEEDEDEDGEMIRGRRAAGPVLDPALLTSPLDPNPTNEPSILPLSLSSPVSSNTSGGHFQISPASPSNIEHERSNREFLESFIAQEHINGHFQEWLAARQELEPEVELEPETTVGESDVREKELTVLDDVSLAEPVLLQPVAYRKRSVASSRRKKGSVASVATVVRARNARREEDERMEAENEGEKAGLLPAPLNENTAVIGKSQHVIVQAVPVVEVDVVDVSGVMAEKTEEVSSATTGCDEAVAGAAAQGPTGKTDVRSKRRSRLGEMLDVFSKKCYPGSLAKGA